MFPLQDIGPAPYLAVRSGSGFPGRAHNSPYLRGRMMFRPERSALRAPTDANTKSRWLPDNRRTTGSWRKYCEVVRDPRRERPG
jgi:hypothetical protein